MTATLVTLPRPTVRGARPPSFADEYRLADLMYAAYLGTIDHEEESVEDALREIQKTFRGDYGVFIAMGSQVVERRGRLVCAVLLTRWQDSPFVAFAMTAPDCKRQGLARGCMVNAMQDLRAQGETRLSLVVTVANDAALRLYRQLGFEPAR